MIFEAASDKDVLNSSYFLATPHSATAQDFIRFQFTYCFATDSQVQLKDESHSRAASIMERARVARFILGITTE